MKWTNKQLEVIDTRDRNILVSAAAGSGKTAVLVERVISMITDETNNINIDELLVVTFTRAAASEMKERIRDRLNEMQEAEPDNKNIANQLALLNNATITTIDSFCSKVVKENIDKIDLDPDYRLADETEIDLIKNDILEEILEESYAEDNEEFNLLAKKYSGGKIYDSISGMVDYIYKKVKSEINPYGAIAKMRKTYDFKNEDEFFKSELVSHFYDIAKSNIDKYKFTLKSASELAQKDAETADLVVNADEFKVVLDKLLSAGDYRKMHELINTIGMPKLSAKRKGTPEIRNVAKSLIVSVRDGIKEIKDIFFSEELSEMYKNTMNCRQSVNMLLNLTTRLLKRFEKEKKEKRIADFSDIAYMALNILNDVGEDGSIVPTNVARQMAGQYKEILIDEYQDSNYVQEAILTSVSRGNGCGNMFMVGDVKQSIYRFRNARPELFLHKYNTYEEDTNAENCKIILDKNFRSRKEVVDSVNFLFENIMSKELGGIDYRDGNKLTWGAQFSEIPQGQSNKTEFVAIATEDKAMEAAYVASRINEMTNPHTGFMVEDKNHQMRRATYKDIVILMRSVKGNSNIYLQALENAGIPAYAESKTGYFNSLEIRTIMNMLTIIDNPRQDIPLVGVMSSAMFGFTDEQLSVIKADNDCKSFYDNVCMYAHDGEDSQCVEKINEFIELLNRYRNSRYKKSVYDIINDILDDTGFDYYVSALSNGKRRHLNIEMLKEKALNYEKSSYRGIFNFVRYIEKIEELDKDEGEAASVSENENVVRISTIHKSKGLQYPIVFLCDTNSIMSTDKETVSMSEDGMISVNAVYTELKTTVEPTIKKYIKYKNKRESRAEYLRILYVALTRAAEKLIITGKVGTKISEYEKEIEKIVAKGTPQPEAYSEEIHENNSLVKDYELLGYSTLFKWMSLVYNRDNNIVKSFIVEEDEIEIQKATAFVKDELRQMTMKAWSNLQIPQNVYDTIVSNFSFEYKYKEDINLCAKASVTELKKESMADEEADEISYNIKEEFEPLVPEFMSNVEKQGSGLWGAKRGSAYHRVFELLDMDCAEYTHQSITDMLNQLVIDKKLSNVQADSINVSDIISFVKSNIFRRMRKAYDNSGLFRERQFLLGVPAKEIKINSNSEELMIMQGIIDVCFIEDGEYVIVDYKTDKVSNMNQLKEKYHVQLECYAKAIEQITGMKVSEKIIYSVTLNDEISI